MKNREKQWAREVGGKPGKYSAMEVKGSMFQQGKERSMVTQNTEINVLIMVRFPGQPRQLI